MIRFIALLCGLIFVVTACQSQAINPFDSSQVLQSSDQIITQRTEDANTNTSEDGFKVSKLYNRSRQSTPTQPTQSRGFFSRFSSFSETKVALLVPLSGNYKDLGQSLVDSAQLALFYLNEPNLVLMPIDTKGTPLGATQAAKEAVARGAKLILGPVFSASAHALKDIVVEHNINVVSFSNDKSLAGTGVFTLGFRPEQQIKRVLEYAMVNGIRDFVYVAPNNSYGAEVAETMRMTTQHNATASVLRSEIYLVKNNGQARNLSSHIRSAYNAALNSRSLLDYNEEKKKYYDVPIIYPRGMLLPEGEGRLKEMLSLLEKRNFDPTKVKLLGSALWVAENLPQNDLLEGAWFAAAAVERRESYEANFEKVYGYKPAAIASLAYDGMALTVALARLSNGNDFSARAITTSRGFTGVNGIFRLQENGLTQRGLAIMEVQDGKGVVIEPSPTNFNELEDREEARQMIISAFEPEIYEDEELEENVLAPIEQF